MEAREKAVREMKMEHWLTVQSVALVEQFHLVFEQPVMSQPCIPAAKMQVLRLHLIQEELGELALAFYGDDLNGVLDALVDLQYVIDGTYLVCGLHYQKELAGPKPWEDVARSTLDSITQVVRLRVFQQKLAVLADGFELKSIDLIFVALERLQEEVDYLFQCCGLYDIKREAMAELQRSNMSKLGPDGKPIFRVGTARIAKGPNYSEPDFSKLLAG